MSFSNVNVGKPVVIQERNAIKDIPKPTPERFPVPKEHEFEGVAGPATLLLAISAYAAYKLWSIPTRNSYRQSCRHSSRQYCRLCKK